jgi:hypothetical protein
VRILVVIAAVLAALVLAAPSPGTTDAAAEPAPELRSGGPAAVGQPDAETQDDGDDVVAVQLVVLAAAIGLVVVVGLAAYFVRRRLGLVAPAPEERTTDAHEGH